MYNIRMDNDKTHQNEVLGNIASRRSTRIFEDRGVNSIDIEMILEAANLAPSAHNQQSWRFVVIEGEKKSELAGLINARSGGFPRPSSVLLRMAARSIASAPVVIAVVNTGRLIQHGTELFKIEKDPAHDFFRVMEIQSSAAAVQNLLLAATSLGLATVWLGILMLIKDEIEEFLVEPHGEFMAVIPVGYASREMQAPHKKPLEKVVKRLS
ncbi:MAG: nitroreductase family protein [Elusimicrobiota bacterium]